MNELVPLEGQLVPMAAPLPPSRNPAAVYLASLAEGPARKTTRNALRRIAEHLGCALEDVPWHELRFEHVAALRTMFAENYAPATANRMLSAIRSVVKRAWLLGLCSEADQARVAAVGGVRGSRLPPGRALELKEVAALFDACRVDEKNPNAGKRDGAAVAMMYGMGLRRAEAVEARTDCYDRETGELRIVGKGNKERRTFATGGAAVGLNRWLDAKPEGPRLLCPVHRSGAIQASRMMTPNALFLRMKVRAAEAGIECSPHDLRRSFVSMALDGGADLAMVQRLAGHANPATTARYDRRGEKAEKQAVAMVPVPCV